MSRADKTTTNAWYDVTVDVETGRPQKLTLAVLTGQKNATITQGDKIVGGEHVAFYFTYDLSKFGEANVNFPEDARRELAKIR